MYCWSVTVLEALSVVSGSCDALVQTQDHNKFRYTTSFLKISGINLVYIF